jgi:excisionase family DNA binding protein
MSSTDRLLTVHEAAEFLQMSPGSLYHLSSQHRVPVIRISSRCIRFSQDALKAWVQSLTDEPESITSHRFRTAVQGR